MKKFIYMIFGFCFISILNSSEKAKVDLAFLQLKIKKEFVNENGETEAVKSLAKKCKALLDCELIVNGREVDPNIIFNENPKTNPTPKKEELKTSELITEQPKQSREATPKGEKDNLVGITDSHNEFRRLKNLPDLVWDDELADYANEWAMNLKKSRKCKMKHRDKNKFGENLAWGKKSNFKAKDVVKMWHDEEANYNYANNSCKGVCGHYTQVVWKNSKKLGCAMAACGDEEVWVCNYDPPGNFVGQKPY